MNRRALRSPVVAGVLSVLAAACDDGAAPPSPDYVSGDEPDQTDNGPEDGEGGEGGDGEGSGGDAAGSGGDGPAGGGSGTETPVWGNCEMDPNSVYIWFQGVPPKGALQGNWFLADLGDLERSPCLIGATPITIDQEGKILGYNDAGRVVQLRPDLPKTSTSVAMKNDAILIPRSQCTAENADRIVPFPDGPGAVASCDDVGKSFLDSNGGRFPAPADLKDLVALGNGGLSLWRGSSEVIIARDGQEVARFKLPTGQNVTLARAKDDGFMVATASPKVAGRLYTISADGQLKGDSVPYPRPAGLDPVLWVLPTMGPDGALYHTCAGGLYRFDPGAEMPVLLLSPGDAVGPADLNIAIQHVAEPITGG